MLYLIGLGLDLNGISQFGLETIKKCKRIYLEFYTVEFPYSKKSLEKIVGKGIFLANREFVESLEIVSEAKTRDVALLVYGSPLMATTHTAILEEAKKLGVDIEIIHNASVFDAIAETGLHLYGFGKIASIPKWDKNFTPTSFINIIKDNQKIDAHSLILVDIGLEFKETINQLLKAWGKDKNSEKIFVCSRLGCKDKRIFYDKIENLIKKTIKPPFCLVIPGKLNFSEKEFIEKLKY
ncbi:diphthine synthase [Candidatus Pacearchaeota archaeon]|nr:diphthine synthase [Candidatus Pacearchaeota archaeon]